MNKFNSIGLAHNIYFTAHKEHPVTYGQNGPDYPTHDTSLTDKHDIGSCLSLDYLIEVDLSYGKEVGLLI